MWIFCLFLVLNLNSLIYSNETHNQTLINQNLDQTNLKNQTIDDQKLSNQTSSDLKLKNETSDDQTKSNNQPISNRNSSNLIGSIDKSIDLKVINESTAVNWIENGLDLNNSMNHLDKLSRSIDGVIWFRFLIQDLLDREMIVNWPKWKRPILKESIYLPRWFLLTLRWIEVKYSTEYGEQYFFKNESNPLEMTDKAVDRQVFFYDKATLSVDNEFVRTIQYNKNNKNGSKQVQGYQSFYPIRFTSPIYPIFTTRPYASRFELYTITNGTFEEFQKINYNQLPKALLSKSIYLVRGFLDYHFHRMTEKKLFGYSSSSNLFDLIELKSKEKLAYYISSDFYTDHVGRFRRWVENIWLMFLKARDAKGNYYYPYRMIQKNAYQQGEDTFYSIEKSKLGKYFHLDPEDKDYMAIFSKLEEEKQDAKVVWISNILLEYLQVVFKSDEDLQNYNKNPKITYKEMVEKLCEVKKSEMTRVITIHILQDYSIFTDGIPMYQYNFSSELILKWTCYSLNEEGCIDRTFSIACRYLQKNYPAKFFPTDRRKEWPLPDHKLVTDDTVQTFVPVKTDPFTVTPPNRFSVDSFPNNRFQYSSDQKPFLDFCFKLILIASFLRFFLI